jgi:hypothetical protein
MTVQDNLLLAKESIRGDELRFSSGRIGGCGGCNRMTRGSGKIGECPFESYEEIVEERPELVFDSMMPARPPEAIATRAINAIKPGAKPSLSRGRNVLIRFIRFSLHPEAPANGGGVRLQGAQGDGKSPASGGGQSHRPRIERSEFTSLSCICTCVASTSPFFE